MATAGSKYTLTFSQIVGEFSVDKELIGKQDPYVVFQSGLAKSQTKAIKSVGAGAARWTETYSLPDFLPSKGTKLHVDVYNHNSLLPDNLIGGGYVDLASLSQEQLSGGGAPVRVLLTDKKGKSTGTLKFVLNGGGFSTSGATTGAATAGTGATAARSGAATTGVTTEATQRTAAAAQPPRGQTAAATAATTGKAVAEGAEIDRAYYTEHQDRAEDQVLVEKFREHRPYVQEYETVVQPTGRVREAGAHVEALGTEVRTVGAETVQDRVDIQSHLPAGVVRQRPAGKGWVEGPPGPVLDATTFEVQGDRVTDKERLTQLREHHDIEKEVAVKTYVREKELAEQAGTEVVDRHRERIGPVTTEQLGSQAYKTGQTTGTTAAGYGSSAQQTGAGYGTGQGVSNTAGTAGTATTSDTSRAATETTEEGRRTAQTAGVAHPHTHAATHRADEYAPRQGGQRTA